MIRIHSLEFQYPSGDFHLDVPEFTVEHSEKVAVIGPSGSGKTTLLNLLAGIYTPQNGSVEVDNISVNRLAEDDRRDFRIANIGFVFQDFELLDYLNVINNILHPYRITGVLRLNKEVRARAVNLARDMGIGDKLNQPVNNLSQGEKQRAAICRALLAQPKLILADEATGNLDPKNKFRILDLLFKSVEDHKATLLAVTHDHELLGKFDRVIDFKNFQKEHARV